MAQLEKHLRAEFEKRLENGDADFSLLMAEAEKLLRDNPDPAFRATVAEAVGQIKGSIAEAETQIRESVAKGQRDIKKPAAK